MANKRDPWDRLWDVFDDDAKRHSLMGDVAPLAADPTLIFAPLNITPDDWQRDVLKSTAQSLLLLLHRQAGKSFIMAALALLEAILNPWAEVLIISRTLRQSTEVLLKVKMFWRGLIGGRVHRRTGGTRLQSLAKNANYLQRMVETAGWDGAALLGEMREDRAVKDLALSLTLPNGARITSLPGNPDTIVGFSAVTLLIIDEASRVSDALYNLVRPFVAATAAVHDRPGRMVVASTPFGKRGWFYEAWNNCEKAKEAYSRGRLAGSHDAGARNGSAEHSSRVRQDDERGDRRNAPPTYSGEDSWLQRHHDLGAEGKEADPPWQAYRVTADQCPRITEEFLANERAQIGVRWYNQEYMVQFLDTTDSVFSRELVESMVVRGDGEKKLWFE